MTAADKLRKDGDFDKLTFEIGDVALARAQITSNIFAFHQENGTDADRLFSEMIGESANEFVNSTLTSSVAIARAGGIGRWGGYLDIVLHGLYSTVKPMLIIADQICSTSTDGEVRQQIRSCVAHTDKTKKEYVMYPVLTRNHYVFGLVIQGGMRKAMFKVGKEADDALGLIIEHIKNNNHVCTALDVTSKVCNITDDNAKEQRNLPVVTSRAMDTNVF
jgi:hypothetical protein